jgi:FMN phosphatase YigB (HAD superfamily)
MQPARHLDVAWDTFIASCEVGVAKPNPRIYHLALNSCHVAPDEAVFVGHDATELVGARRIGLRTVAFAYDADVQADDYITQFPDLLLLPYLQTPSEASHGAG